MINGPSGCGKSTLLNIIGLLDRPTYGNYLIENVETSDLGENNVTLMQQQYFGFLFQHFHLLEGFSALENVVIPLLINGMGNQEAANYAEKLFEIFSIGQLKHHSVATLSGGEAQRVALIRALAKRPRIILADEPTGALDDANRQFVLETLKKISCEKLVIVVSHDLDATLPFADRVISMEQGRIIKDVSISEIDEYQTAINHTKKIATCNLSLVTRRLFKLSRHHFFWAIASLSFSILTSMLTIGINHGSKTVIRRHPLLAANANIVYVSRINKIPIAGSPLSLLRYTRPTLHEVTAMMHRYPRAYVDVSLRGPLSFHYNLIIDGNVSNNIRFEPYFDENNTDDFSNVLINEEAANLINFNHARQINIKYQVNQTIFSTNSEGLLSQDLFTLETLLHPSKIISDIRFQAVPVIYYSHTAARLMLNNYRLEYASISRASNYSMLNRIIESPANDQLGNYEMIIGFDDSDDLINFYDNWDSDDSMSCAGSYFQEREFIGSILHTINYGLIFFVSISCLSGVMTMVISLMHFYKLHRRRLAILWSLGANRKQLMMLIRKVSRFVVLTALAIGISLTPIAQLGINRLVTAKLKISNLMQIPYLSLFGIPGGLVLIITILIVFIVDLCAMVSARMLRTDTLSDELKDDD